jgi:hypothetical protein
MALKSGGLSHRHETSMLYTLDRAAEPGTLVVASGVDGKVDIAGGTAAEVGASGVLPMGVLLNTREEFNYAKELERVQYDTDDIGTVVTLLRRGELDTNMLVENGGVAIATGQPAYLAPNGRIGNANLAVDGGEQQRVGQWMESVDSDGFARVRIELQ